MARPKQQTSTAPAPLFASLPKPRREVVALDLLDFTPFNKRRFVEGDPKNQELTTNIQVLGQILEPPLVRPVGDRYCVIAGERRVRCGRRAGLTETDVLVYEIDEPTANILTFVENFHRSDLHCLEEAAAVADLVAGGCSQEMIAAQIGKPVKWVALRARLINLSSGWREAALDESLLVRLWSPSHLEVIALLSQAAQEEMLTLHDYLLETDPTIAQLRAIVAERTRLLAEAPFRLDDETLCPQAGACSVCLLRSSAHLTLFEDLVELPEKGKPKDRCLDPSCWKSKVKAQLARREAELRADHPNLVLLSSTSLQDGAVAAWKTRPAKKGQAGAVPAFVLDGVDQGKLRWVVLPEPTRPASPAAAGNLPVAPAPPQPGQRAKTSLAERRAAKDRQRKLRATQTLVAAVAEATEVPPLLTILGLVSVFGTQQTNSTGWQIYDRWLLETWPEGLQMSPLALWKLAEDLAAAPATAEDLGAHLWKRVLPVLLKRTDTLGTPDDVLRAWDEASRLGALVGVDGSQHLAQATADLPDPQSWTAEAAAMARAAAQAAAAIEADLAEDEVDEEEAA
jgi:ParB family chromosome partitioning protein